MKKGMRIVALLLALAMTLSVSAAFADAYTVPKDLKAVEGLPENPEAPTMKTKNDGHTETVTVTGELKSLAANWNNELFPLELVDGVATFSIDGHNVQLGMAAKHNSWTSFGNSHMEYYAPLDTWIYHPIAKAGYNSDVTVPGCSKEQGSYSDWGYVEYRIPYAESVKPGYQYSVPTAIYEPEPEDPDDDDDDDDDEEEMSEEELKKWQAYWELQEKYWEEYYDAVYPDGRYEELIKDLEYTGNYSNKDYYTVSKKIEAMKRDGATEEAIKKELDNAFAALGTTEYDNWYGSYDTMGEVHVRDIIKETTFWSEDIKFFGDAFQGELMDGKTLAHYNRKGECCEKEITMDAGVDFFESEKAPTKVVVVYSSGKNMYNKTVWYISKIQQVYDDVTVTASFAQNGKLQKGGIKEKANAK